MSDVTTVLRRDSVVVATALVVLVLLAWLYLWRGAGMGMTALDMTILTLFPHTQAEPMPGMMQSPPVWLVTLTMWWVMMIAMMTPSAAPLILLYSRIRQHAAHPSASQAAIVRYASPLLLTAGYLLAWLAFSLLATALQHGLQRLGLISPMVLWSKSSWLSAAVLVGTGLYQLSPLKQVCLKHCRGPADFLMRHSRQGQLGALAMGMEHGAWCVGCCWTLMLLLFIGGVMNIVWIALLTLLVVAEKLAPGGATTARLSGAVLIVWGLVTLAIQG